MANFLKSFNCLSASRAALPMERTAECEARGWEGSTATFKFREGMEYYNQLLRSHPVSEEYAIGPE